MIEGTLILAFQPPHGRLLKAKSTLLSALKL
jgi:hypothetical protein